MKELMKKYNKMVVGCSIVIIAIVVGIITINAVSNNKKLILKNEVFYVEYGNIATTNIREYLDTSSLDKDTKKDILDHAVLNIDIGNELDKAFPMIGEYEGSISYKDATVKFKIIVQDTVAPTLIDFKPYQFTYVDVVPNYAEIYIASDLSGDVVVEINDSNINYTTIGSYEATVTATDVYDNVFSIKITVVVSEPVLEVKQKDYTLTVDDTVTLEVTIKGKEEKATFTSSDSNIVTVDENGNIVAINQGSTTIIVTANGKEETANITVNAKPVTNTNTSSGGSSSSGANSSNTSNSNSNNNSSSNTDSGGTPSNTCTYSYTPIDEKFFASEAEMKEYFTNTYGPKGTKEYHGYGGSIDSCGRYYIDSMY